LCIDYCPTGEMLGDFMTKPVQGFKYDQFRNAIMGFMNPKKFRPAKAGDRSVLEECDVAP